MNRKRKEKMKRAVARSVAKMHPYDDPCEWMKGDFTTSPWTKERTAEFQKKLDSAFGAENAIVLVWSGDRSYGDAFYTDWYANGLPKGKLERKPVLLFGEYKINEHDYFYVSCPRFLLMEVHHGSELASSWQDSMWVQDPELLGGRKQIRASEPPKYFYQHLRIIAEHTPAVSGEMPTCCAAMLKQNRICYGRYREPSELDVAYVRRIRENMDRAGVAQRNDEKRSAKVLQDAALSTRYFIKRAEQQRALGVQEYMMENAGHIFADVLKEHGSTMSTKEVRECLKEAFDEQNQERFT